MVPFTDEPKPSGVSKSGVIVAGMDDMEIKFAKCCTPLPGDEIIAFITKGHGISIHKRTCSNVPKDIAASENADRWLDAKWADMIDTFFSTVIEIKAFDRTGLVADLSGQLGNMKIHIHNMSSRSVANGRAIVLFNITVKDKAHLRDIFSRLNSVKGVISVSRTNKGAI